jgi:hypothetical protein
MHRILYSNIWGGLLVMVSYVTFNNISIISYTWQSILWVEETWVPEENYRPVASHWQILSHNVASNTPRHERNSNSQLITQVVSAYQH